MIPFHSRRSTIIGGGITVCVTCAATERGHSVGQTRGGENGKRKIGKPSRFHILSNASSRLHACRRRRRRSRVCGIVSHATTTQPALSPFAAAATYYAFTVLRRARGVTRVWWV